MVDVQAEARAVLEGYLARPESDQANGLVVAAERLLAQFAKEPERISSLVVGERTPNGRPTFSALVTARDTQGAVARGLASPIAMPTPMDPATRPSEPLTIIEQGASGGPEVDSTEYRHHRLRYPRLNAVQALVLPWVDRDVNLVVAASTSAGKSTIAEMFMGEGLSRGGRALFLSPLRAVSQEKFEDWTDPQHAWQQEGRGVSIITGDYRLTDARVKELNEASVVVLTTEMLNVRCRMQRTEKSAFLSAAATLVADEAHLLSMEGRGDALEVGLMLFTKQNPNARIVLLSATMPNVEDLGRWLTRMTGRPTVVIRSAWRPTTLGIEYQGYYDRGSYQVQETTKVRAALGIVQQYKDDRFIVFVHAKKTGQTILESLRRLGIEAEFHSADLERDARLALEKRFKSGNLRVLVSTPTLAWGCYRYGTLVAMGDGRAKPIEDVVVGDEVKSLVGGRFMPRRVNRVGSKVVDSALRVRLQSGEVCDVSGDHLFYGATGRQSPTWVRADSLSVGDLLAIASDYREQRHSRSFDRRAYLLGYIHGDGSIYKADFHADGAVKFGLDIAAGDVDVEHLRHVARMMADEFQQEIKSPRQGADGVWHLCCKKRAVVESIRAEFDGWDKSKLRMPVSVEGDMNRTASYLSGLFDTDGWVQDQGGAVGNFAVGFSTISEPLAYQVRHHLTRFGIRSSVYRKRLRDSVINGRLQVARREFIWQVTIFNANAKRFGSEIGFYLDRKRNRLDQFSLNPENNRNSSDVVPVRDALREYLGSDVSARGFRRETGNDLWAIAHKKEPTRATLAGVVEKFPREGPSRVKELLAEDIVWRRITEITRVEGGTFQDIEVEESHNFVGAGIVSHNCNLPARRVVVVGVHRGMQLVDSMDVIQMVGRAGRYGIDPRGDAHVLLPESKLGAYQQRFSTVEPIKSRLRKLDELAFHLTAEVSDGEVRTPAAAVEWHARSFAALQGESMDEGHEAQEDDTQAPSAWQVVSRLCRVGVLARTPQNEIEATPLGRVAAHLYFSPFDAAWWAGAFRRLAEQGLTRDDMAIAWAVGEAPSFRRGDYIAKDLKDEHARFADNLSTLGIPDTEPTTKTMALWYHLRGIEPPDALRPVLRGFQRDAGRVSQAISQIDRRVLRVLGTIYCELLGIRVAYGVNWEAADICRLPGIGPKRAEQLLGLGIRSIAQVVENETRVLRTLGAKIGGDAIAKAKEIAPLPWKTTRSGA